PKKITVQVESVDNPVADSGHVLVACAMNGIGHIERAPEILDVERRESCRQILIHEVTGKVGSAVCALQYIDLTALEIRGVSVAKPADHGLRDPLVDVVRVGGLKHLGGGSKRASPTGDRSVLGDKQKGIAVESNVVEHDASDRSVARNRHHKG